MNEYIEIPLYEIIKGNSLLKLNKDLITDLPTIKKNKYTILYHICLRGSIAEKSLQETMKVDLKYI